MEYRPNVNAPAPEEAKVQVFEHAGRVVRAMGSVAYATPADHGQVIVTGSHGGRSAGEYAARIAPLVTVTNDAGFGKNQAGVAGLKGLDAFHMIGVAVGHRSARIAETLDGWQEGVISFVNETGRHIGLRTGVALRGAIEALLHRLPPDYPIRLPPVGAWSTAPMRRDIVHTEGGLRVIAADSASLLAPGDEGQIVIAAGNGGIESGMVAANRGCALVALNDAGIGKDRAGVAGLDVLDRSGIPGVGVDHESAEISNGMDTWNHGLVSCANRAATEAGIRPGMAVRDAILLFLSRRTQP